MEYSELFTSEFGPWGICLIILSVVNLGLWKHANKKDEHNEKIREECKEEREVLYQRHVDDVTDLQHRSDDTLRENTKALTLLATRLEKRD